MSDWQSVFGDVNGLGRGRLEGACEQTDAVPMTTASESRAAKLHRLKLIASRSSEANLAYSKHSR